MQRLVTDVGYPIERVTSQRGRMASAASAAIGSIATTVSAAMVAVSFSSCQQNLIKTFQIEAIIALITKMAMIFS